MRTPRNSQKICDLSNIQFTEIERSLLLFLFPVFVDGNSDYAVSNISVILNDRLEGLRKGAGLKKVHGYRAPLRTFLIVVIIFEEYIICGLFRK